MNKHMLDTSTIARCGMVPAIRTREIIMVKIMTQEEKIKYQEQRGRNDILVTTASGALDIMGRAELIQRYRHLNGKQIQLAGWEAGKNYTVYRDDHTEVLIMQVPLNCTAEINGNYANRSSRYAGDYIVTIADDNGEPDLDSMVIYPANLFRKMFYIPRNEVIQRNIGKGNKEFNPEEFYSRKMAERQKVATDKQRQQNEESAGNYTYSGNDYVSDIHLNTENIRDKENYYSRQNYETNTDGFGLEEIYSTPSEKVNTGGMRISTPTKESKPAVDNRQAKENQNSSQNTGYRYRAVGRIVKPNGQIVGFLVESLNGSGRNQVTYNQMMGACSKKLVQNVMLVNNPNGGYFLKGNGISLDQLPSYPEEMC